MDLKDLLRQEDQVRQEIFRYFGYLESWTVYPFNDATNYFWYLNETETRVTFATNHGRLLDEDRGEYYVNEVMQKRNIPSVYVGAEYTMILVDTHCDGNKFLQIFDNRKRVVME